MRAILYVVLEALNLYKYVVVGAAVLSWLIAFNVVNIRNEFVRSIWNLLDALTTPLLRPIRNFLPNMGGIDISPVIFAAGHHARRAIDPAATSIPMCSEPLPRRRCGRRHRGSADDESTARQNRRRTVF